MVIDLSVTPWSVAPLALPGPHGDASVPNFTPGAWVVVVATAAAVVVAGGALRPLLHAAARLATSTATPTTAHPRTAPRCIWSPSGRCVAYTVHYCLHNSRV